MHVLSLCGQEVGLSKNPSVSSLVLTNFLFHCVLSVESEELCFPELLTRFAQFWSHYCNYPLYWPRLCFSAYGPGSGWPFHLKRAVCGFPVRISDAVGFTYAISVGRE